MHNTQNIMFNYWKDARIIFQRLDLNTLAIKTKVGLFFSNIYSHNSYKQKRTRNLSIKCHQLSVKNWRDTCILREQNLLNVISMINQNR